MRSIIMRRQWPVLAALLSVAMTVLAIHMLALVMGDPVVRRFDYEPADWPRGTPPLRVVLMTDIHVHNLGRSRDRIARSCAR